MKPGQAHCTFAVSLLTRRRMTASKRQPADDPSRPLVTAKWSRYTAERLGIELVEIGGDHSPFLGRAGELAGVVLERLGGVLGG